MGIDFCSIIISRKIAFDLIFKRVTKEPQSDFQSQFPMSKNIAVFLNIIHWKNAILGEHLLSKIRSNFWWLVWMPVKGKSKKNRPELFLCKSLPPSCPFSSKFHTGGHANVCISISLIKKVIPTLGKRVFLIWVLDVFGYGFACLDCL